MKGWKSELIWLHVAQALLNIVGLLLLGYLITEALLSVFGSWPTDFYSVDHRIEFFLDIDDQTGTIFSLIRMGSRFKFRKFSSFQNKVIPRILLSVVTLNALFFLVWKMIRRFSSADTYSHKTSDVL